MEPLKFFILDSECGDALEEVIRDTATELGDEIRTTLSTDFKVTKLPRDYDGYLLHLSNTSEEAVRELRREQPWSKIFGISGGGIYGALIFSRRDLDGLYWVISSEDAKSIISKTREIYTVNTKQ